MCRRSGVHHVIMDPAAAIPDFPDSRPLSLEDKPRLDAIFATLQPRISEYTFAGLYLFRQAHAYRLCQVADGVLTILGQGYDGAHYALPPLAADPVRAAAALLQAGVPLYGVTPEWLGQFGLPAGGRVVPDRDSFDYLYAREGLATLAGRRYHKKLNRVNYFTRRHDYRVVMFEASLRPGCLSLLATLSRLQDGAEMKPSLAAELAACAEALQLHDLLGLEGLVVLVSGKVAAFALGERLNRETTVCHFEKMDPFLEGVGQLINREYARLLFTDSPLINREQDLGEPGLRAAKLSYHPQAMVEKYRVYPA